MNRADRAKQFLPFDALKGLQEELRDKEEKHMRVEKRELTEETADILSSTLNKLDKGKTVEVEYYKNGRYLCKKGKLIEKNIPYQYLVIGDLKVYLDDLYELKIID